MKKKKLLFLIESFIVGGAEKVLIDLVNNLSAEEYDITVCSVFKHSVYKEYDNAFDKPFKPHIKYRYLINNNIQGIYVLFNYLIIRIPNFLFKLLVGNNYNIVIAFYEGLPTFWIAQAKLYSCKKIAWLHTLTELSQKGKSKEELEKQKKYYSKYDQIIAVSKRVANSFTKLFPQLEQSIKVIYNPINITNIQEKAIYPIQLEKKNFPTFVCVGRITEVKGYDRWLRVLLRLKNKGYKFQSWIIGGGDREIYEQFVIENQLTDYVVFLGHQDNPYPYIAKADWVVCPSLLEGLGNIVLEGIALNKAIIVTDGVGAKEFLENNQSGIICKNNEEDIEKVIENIIHNDSLKGYYELCIKKQSKDFTISSIIKHIEELFNA